ncbi:MAG TPA: alpha-(1-_3)-arabinofuranosyltransferase family protein [Acidimicrobiia bacterium]|nr:alpha-(1->3)-arabinofuranosyltransferase family protein [Acidimicrobiia bacterium]
MTTVEPAATRIRSETLAPAREPRVRRAPLFTVAGFALIAYVPFFLSSPGDVSADTKQYLYLDPGRLLSRAAYLWDANFGGGTVTHQNIGYLWPMGPYYWVTQQLGVPAWFAQRIWLGSITFAAGLGVLFLLRTLDRRGAGAIVAGLVYMLSPYPLAYTARISAILLPWAGLPWLIALAIRSLRRGGWRDPAVFALVVFTIGGTNATSLIFAGVGPVLWIVFAVFVEREVSFRHALAVTARIGFLVFVTSLWWIAGLSVQSGYGLPVLDYTETVKTVATASAPLEILRGLGNWFFYGRDGLGLWIEQSAQYQQDVWLLVVGFLLPIIAFVSAVCIRWRHRAYFVALVIIGMVIAVGPYPYGDPSYLGRLFKSFAEGSTVGLALRSTPRAVPLVVLGVAVLIGAGVDALTRVRVGAGVVAALVVGVLAIANLPPAWGADYIAKNLERPEDIPSYWTDAAKYLDAQGNETRVLELPGSDFSAYRWGNTVDPLLPGLMRRPYVERELIPFGSQASADLLLALDRRVQEGTFEPQAVAPIARMFATGDVVVRYDLQYERYRTPRPRLLFTSLATPPPGLGTPVDFGPRTRNQASPEQPMIDATELAIPPSAPDPPKVQVYPVADAEKIVHTSAAADPVLVAGDGEGLVDAASAGVLDGRSLVLYSASFAKDHKGLQRELAAGADLVVTDTNRRAARHWGAIRDVTGYTERAGEKPLVKDPGDKPLEPFPGAGDDTKTVTEQRGVASVMATTYGDPLFLSPENRPAMAFDGDPSTAWIEGAGAKAVGESLVIDLGSSVTTDHVTLVQPQTGIRDRYITGATLTFDGKDSTSITLGPDSRTAAGQVVTFPKRTFHKLSVTVDTVESPTDGLGPVGFAEVVIPGHQPVDELVRLPVDLLRAAGKSSLDHNLTLVMTRMRGSQAEYVRTDEELALRRVFDLPAGRSFAVTGTARLDGRAPDETLDAVLGVPDAAHGGITATASSHLAGDVRARASKALDGDPSTAWSSDFGDVTGSWLDYQFANPVTFDHLDLQVVADGRHSVPTQLTLQPAGGAPVTVPVPGIADTSTPNGTVTVPLRFAPITTSRLRVTISAVRPEYTIEYFSRSPLELPVSIAEVGIPGARVAAPPVTFSGACRTDLLTVDGRPVGVRFAGDTTTAEQRGTLDVQLCGAGAESGVTLGSGEHVLVAKPGRDTALDLDRLTLASARGGAPRTTALLGHATPGPKVKTVDSGPVSYDLKVTNASAPFWLVLAQSHNDGWKATRSDGTSLGEPTVVDGMANGWLVDPKGHTQLTVHLEWTPQKRVWLGIGLSAAGVLLCLVLLFARRRRRGAPPAVRGAADDDPPVVRPFRWHAAPGPAAERGRPPNGWLAGVTVAMGLLATLIATPAVGLFVAAATLVAALARRGRLVLRGMAVAALVLVVGYVVVQQIRFGYPAQYDWPQRFLRFEYVPWVAVLLLVADVVLDYVPGGAERPRTA